MDIIIRLIISIFEAIFEQDTKRRGQPQKQAKTLEEWLAQMQGQTTAQPPARSAAQPSAPAAKEKKPAAKLQPPPPVFVAVPEPEPELAPATRVTRRKRQSGRRLAGTIMSKTSRPLSLMVYSQVILGPPLAIRARFGKGMKPPYLADRGIN